MPEPYVGEIKLVSWNYAPQGWAFCDGTLLSISQFAPLFSLIGTTYGGDGVRTFALPDLRGRAAMQFGQQFQLGNQSGEPTHTLTNGESPIHSHSLVAATTPGNSGTVALGQWLAGITDGKGGNGYAPPPTDPTQLTTLDPSTIGPNGAGLPHENRQPYLCLSYAIALAGIFPSKP